MTRVLSILILISLFSCAGDKPPPSGTPEDLALINAFIKRFEEKQGIDLDHDDVLIGIKDGAVAVFLRLDDDSDYYVYLSLKDVQYTEDEFGVTVSDFVWDTFSPKFRYHLIMDTTMFGTVYEYTDYAGSVESGTLFEEHQLNPKDLERLGAIIESNKKRKLTETFVSRYGLSAEKSQEISNLVFHFNKIQSRRSLTKRELNHFSSKILGISLTQFKEIIIDQQRSRDLIEDVAHLHETTPEVIDDILTELFLN